jgi:hypothetical protein
MEDDIAKIRYQSNTLQNFRRDIQPFWDDQAAHEINLRYLNAHEHDDEQMRKSFDEQYRTLSETKDKLNSADQHAHTIEKLAHELDQYLEYCKQDADVAYQMYEEHRQHLSISESLFPEIVSLVNKANEVCEGVPRE